MKQWKRPVGLKVPILEKHQNRIRLHKLSLTGPGETLVKVDEGHVAEDIDETGDGRLHVSFGHGDRKLPKSNVTVHT